MIYIAKFVINYHMTDLVFSRAYDESMRLAAQIFMRTDARRIMEVKKYYGIMKLYAELADDPEIAEIPSFRDLVRSARSYTSVGLTEKITETRMDDLGIAHARNLSGIVEMIARYNADTDKHFTQLSVNSIQVTSPPVIIQVGKIFAMLCGNYDEKLSQILAVSENIREIIMPDCKIHYFLETTKNIPQQVIEKTLRECLDRPSIYGSQSNSSSAPEIQIYSIPSGNIKYVVNRPLIFARDLTAINCLVKAHVSGTFPAGDEHILFSDIMCEPQSKILYFAHDLHYSPSHVTILAQSTSCVNKTRVETKIPMNIDAWIGTHDASGQPTREYYQQYVTDASRSGSECVTIQKFSKTVKQSGFIQVRTNNIRIWKKR